MPAHLIPDQREQRPLEAIPVLNNWVRVTLLGLTAGLVIVFAVAAWLNPYDADGQALQMETHRQLGLPPCTFYVLTGGLPCPSCGMTTSFALLMHGDVWNSLQANAAGTLLALLGLAFIPWSLATIRVVSLGAARAGNDSSGAALAMPRPSTPS